MQFVNCKMHAGEDCILAREFLVYLFAYISSKLLLTNLVSASPFSIF
jgi:hypothetical protein